jgi:hypothetical protein
MLQTVLRLGSRRNAFKLIDSRFVPHGANPGESATFHQVSLAPAADLPLLIGYTRDQP